MTPEDPLLFYLYRGLCLLPRAALAVLSSSWGWLVVLLSLAGLQYGHRQVAPASVPATQGKAVWVVNRYTGTISIQGQSSGNVRFQVLAPNGVWIDVEVPFHDETLCLKRRMLWDRADGVGQRVIEIPIVDSSCRF